MNEKRLFVVQLQIFPNVSKLAGFGSIHVEILHHHHLLVLYLVSQS